MSGANVIVFKILRWAATLSSIWLIAFVTLFS